MKYLFVGGDGDDDDDDEILITIFDIQRVLLLIFYIYQQECAGHDFTLNNNFFLIHTIPLNIVGVTDCGAGFKLG